MFGGQMKICSNSRRQRFYQRHPEGILCYDNDEDSNNGKEA